MSRVKQDKSLESCDFRVDDTYYCIGSYDDPIKELREEADRLRLLATFLEEEAAT